jgi:lipopolysaccharide export system protein LptC
VILLATLILLVLAAVLIAWLGRFEDEHLEDAFDPQDRERLGK